MSPEFKERFKYIALAIALACTALFTLLVRKFGLGVAIDVTLVIAFLSFLVAAYRFAHYITDWKFLILTGLVLLSIKGFWMAIFSSAPKAVLDGITIDVVVNFLTTFGKSFVFMGDIGSFGWVTITMSYLLVISGIILRFKATPLPQPIAPLALAFMKGQGSIESNINLLKKIAESDHPEKQATLVTLLDNNALSFLERDVLSEWIGNLQAGEELTEKEKIVLKEEERLRKIDQLNDDEFLLKLHLLRHGMRANHPDFPVFQKLLAKIATEGLSNEVREMAGKLRAKKE